MKNSMLSYIAGFFDADGSITMTRFKKNETKSLAVSFTNTELSILEAIQQEFASNGIKGWIVKSPKRKEHHLQGQQLVYYRSSAIRVMELIYPHILHDKKIERYQLFQTYYKSRIKRNGKYSQSEKDELELIAQKIIDIK